MLCLSLILRLSSARRGKPIRHEAGKQPVLWTVTAKANSFPHGFRLQVTVVNRDMGRYSRRGRSGEELPGVSPVTKRIANREQKLATTEGIPVLEDQRMDR
jgi:hypothetical protein